jgi:hypothetical protein
VFVCPMFDEPLGRYTLSFPLATSEPRHVHCLAIVDRVEMIWIVSLFGMFSFPAIFSGYVGNTYIPGHLTRNNCNESSYSEIVSSVAILASLKEVTIYYLSTCKRRGIIPYRYLFAHSFALVNENSD